MFCIVTPPARRCLLCPYLNLRYHEAQAEMNTEFCNFYSVFILHLTFHVIRLNKLTQTKYIINEKTRNDGLSNTNRLLHTQFLRTDPNTGYAQSVTSTTRQHERTASITQYERTLTEIPSHRLLYENQLETTLTI